MKPQMLWLAGCGILMAGCGGGALETKKEAAAPAPAASAPIADAGSISGKVAFIGQKPAPKTISMDATPNCARQHSGPMYAEDVVISGNGTVKNVFVRIREGLPAREWAAPTTAVKLDQKGCIYAPRVIGVMVNQPIEISNSDDTNHNIHPLPRVNREWNESQPPKGDVKVKTFPKEEMPPILFKCNVHPWMRAWVGVMAHPYYAVTGDDGIFRIHDVPPGEYTLEAWHERFGVQELKIRVEPKQPATAEFTFKGE